MRTQSFVRDLQQKAKLFFAIARARYGRQPRPVVVNLFLTGACNSRCSYCYVDIPTATKREFNMTEWRELVDQLIARGTRMISLVGGEPLLFPGIGDLVAYIRGKNIFLNLTTNGYLLERYLDVARQASEVSISLDGNRQSHDANRGSGTYDKAMRGIRAAVAAGVPVRLCTVITKNNVADVDDLIRTAEELRCSITFSPLIAMPAHRQQTGNQLRLADDELRKVFRMLKEKKQQTALITNSIEGLDYMIKYPVPFEDIVWRESAESGYYPHRCPYGQGQFHIASTGEVYPCGTMWNNANFTPKNIFAVGLDAALINAGGLKCQCCSFANAVDWNAVVSARGVVNGFAMTMTQFMKRTR